MKKEVKVKMDYESEFKRLQEGGNFWKPKPGQYKLKALTELEETDPYIKDRSDGSKEAHPQAKMKIRINDDEEKIWTFGKGATLASTYGQLTNLAHAKGNKLLDLEFNVIVKSDGTKNDYTIVMS